jgi:DNA-binding transcriptional LysR family regulator
MHPRHRPGDRPAKWEFRRGNDVVPVAVNGRLTVTDASTKLGACLAGFGVAQVIDLGVADHLRDGRLINLFPDWPDERFPLYVYHVSRNHVPAKVRAFIDFVSASLRERDSHPVAALSAA